MDITYIKENGKDIAVISSDVPVITDAQSSLDLAMTVKYETGAARLVLDKSLVCEDFFILSTRLAGEILQKFINYHVKAAIFGDFSHYTSKPLHDFIYESNQGKDFFFVSTKEEPCKGWQTYKMQDTDQRSGSLAASFLKAPQAISGLGALLFSHNICL